MRKKIVVGSAAVFLLACATEYAVNAYLMKGEYQQVAQLWRTPEETKFGVLLVSQLFFAFFFTLIFSKGYHGKGIVEGIRFGIFVALMMMVPAAYITYATMPVPYALALKRFLYGILQFVLYGITLALIFRKESAH
jgi:hypothetical protein